MKKFGLLTAAATFMIALANAQDTIVFKNADEISAKVTAVTPENVSYKKWENPDGPVYTMSSADIFCIKYQNGQKDVFGNVKAGNSTKGFDKIRFQSYIYAGAVFLKRGCGPTLDVNVGARLYDYAYIGIEAGFHYLFVNQKIYYTNRYGESVKTGTR